MLENSGLFNSRRAAVFCMRCRSVGGGEQPGQENVAVVQMEDDKWFDPTLCIFPSEELNFFSHVVVKGKPTAAACCCYVCRPGRLRDQHACKCYMSPHITSSELYKMATMELLWPFLLLVHQAQCCVLVGLLIHPLSFAISRSCL